MARPNAKVIASALALAYGMSVTYEGTFKSAYLDPVGIPTACTGHTAGVRLGQTYSLAECRKLLDADEYLALLAVLNLTTGDINANQLGAFTDFVFNVGPEKFRTSTMLRKFNAGDYTGACNEFPRWVYATDGSTHKLIKLPGLVKRREAEKKLCLSRPAS